MSQWAGKIAERVESGLSITAYCRREEMPTNRYFYWQRRLRKAAVAELSVQEREEAQLPPAGWAQIVAAEGSEKVAISEVTIEIGKCRVMANESTDTELLTKICKVLVSIC